MESSLRSAELYFYFFIWILANLYTLNKLFVAQTDVLETDQELVPNLWDLQPGWSFLGRLKDVSDVEWSSWKYYLNVSWFFLIVQFVVNEVVRRKTPTHLKYWYIILSTMYVILHMGCRHMIIVTLQPILYGAIIYLGGEKISIWFTSITLLFFYNSLKYNQYFWTFLEHDNFIDEEVYLILFCIAWIELRCISFCLDYIERDKKTYNLTMTETFINMLSYVLYMPLLYSGPIILYEEFTKSLNMNSQSLSIRIKKCLWDITLFMLYTFMMDLSLHYIYFYAMQSRMESIRKMPTLALCGGGLYMGLQFHIKYVISYGTSAAFARLDHIEPPPTPRCIARIHVYSQMWRHFDVGLYRFLVKYIYKPSAQIMSNKYNLPKTVIKLLSSLLTFFFIFMWHGTIKRILVWSVLNYAGITLEYLSKDISKTEYYKTFKNNILRTDAMETRFIGFLCVPLLALSAISNFYLFAGTEVGDLFFESFTHPSLWNSVIICASLYCCCQVSMALANFPSRTDCKSCALQNFQDHNKIIKKSASHYQ